MKTLTIFRHAKSSWNFPELTDHEILADEKALLGFYVSGHPLAEFQTEIDKLSTHHAEDIEHDSARRRHPRADTGVVGAGWHLPADGEMDEVGDVLDDRGVEPHVRALRVLVGGEIDRVAPSVAGGRLDGQRVRRCVTGRILGDAQV